MASNLLKTFEKIERGRQKCIAKANEVDFPLPDDASLEKIAQCIDNQGHIDTYINEFKALIDGDFSRLRDADTFRIPADIEEIAPNALCNLNAKNIVLSEGITDIGSSSCKNWVNFEDDLILPDTLTSIGNSAFYKIGYENGCGVITVPHSVKQLGIDVFEANGAKIFNFDADVTEIPQSLCEATSKDYARLEEFNISDELVNKITKVGGSAFRYQNKLERLPNFPNVTELGSYAFANCAPNEKFIVPSTWSAKISFHLFDGTNFKGGLEIENGNVLSTDECAFANIVVNQQRLIIPENLYSFGTSTFDALSGNYTYTANSKEWVGLERLDILNKNKILLGYGMFDSAKIKTIVIHASEFGYTNANGRYFQYMNGVKELVLPNAPATPPFTNTIFYQGQPDSIYVPDAYVSTYQTATSWKTASSRIKPLSQWPGYADYLVEFGGTE